MSKSKQHPIALFSPSLAGGGAERVLINLAGGMIDQREVVDIVLAKATGQQMAHVPREARLVDLGAGRTLTSLYALAQYMRERQPRAIICFQDHATIVALWARTLARTPMPIVATVHNTWSHLLAGGTSKMKFLARCARHSYNRVESVVAVSEGAADDLAATLRLPRQKIRVIYNPVIGPELFERAKDALTHPWFAQGCPPLILGIGRLTRQKDFSTLVRAFVKLRCHMPCRLMILGEGEERASLEALAASSGFKDDIALPGFVENPYKYLSRTSLFVLSSLSEGLPTVLIEAMALGVPVVSTDCESGPSEILEGGLHGKLVGIDDPTALAGAMLQTLLDKRPLPGGVHRFHVDRVTEEYRSLVNEISH